MEVVEAPTLDTFQSRVSNWKTTNSTPPPQLHPSPTSPILIFFMSDQYYCDYSEHSQL